MKIKIDNASFPDHDFKQFSFCSIDEAWSALKEHFTNKYSVEELKDAGWYEAAAIEWARPPVSAEQCGMTDLQAAWASRHDWYRWSECIGPGQFKVHVRQDTGDDRTTFTDYQELRGWAGY